MKIISFIGICLLVFPVTIHGEIMGIDSPGTTDYSDWFGYVNRSYMFAYDSCINDLTYNSERNSLLFMSTIHSAPYIREFMLNNYVFTDPLKYHFSAGRARKYLLIEELDSLYLLCDRDDESIIYELNQITSAIEGSIILPQKPLAIEFAYDLCKLIYVPNSDNDSVVIWDFQLGNEETLDLSMLVGSISTIYYSPSERVIYVFSDDTPSRILKIDIETFFIEASYDLPAERKVRNFSFDKESSCLYLSVYNALPFADYSIMKLDTHTMDLLGQVEMEEDLNEVRLIDAQDDQITALALGAACSIQKYDSSLSLVDEVVSENLSNQITCAKTILDKIVITDASEPAGLEIFNKTTLESTFFSPMPDYISNLQSIGISHSENEYIVTTADVEPCRAIVIDSQLLERTDSIELSMSYNTLFNKIKISDSLGKIAISTRGLDSNLLIFDLYSKQLLAIHAVEDNQQITDFVFNSLDSCVYFTTESKVFKYDLELLSITDFLEISYENRYLTCISSCFSSGYILVANISGKLLKCGISPLRLLEAANVFSDGGSIESELLIPEYNLALFSKNGFYPETASIAFLDLENLTSISTIACDLGENDISEMAFDQRTGLVNIGLFRSAPRIIFIDPVDRVRVGHIERYNFPRFISDCQYNSIQSETCFCNYVGAGQLLNISSTRKNCVWGSRYGVNTISVINSMNFYSNQADGFLRLGILNGNRERIWQSDSIENTVTEGWVSIPINQGHPEYLTLEPGEYWLVFQVDSLENVPSVHPGEHGDGLRQAMPFGEFPDKLHFPEFTSDRYAVYAEWQYLYPTATPTATPSPSPSPTATLTPIPSATETPIPTATMSPTPPPTSTPTSTAVPDPGVKLQLESHWFQPGDLFSLTAEVNPDFNNLSDVNLWVVLDVYSSYWFGPVWSQAPDWYPLGELSSSHNELILQFQWPDVEGSAENLVFWGALLTAEDNQLVGFYDYVSFGYSG